MCNVNNSPTKPQNVNFWNENFRRKPVDNGDVPYKLLLVIVAAPQTLYNEYANRLHGFQKCGYF